MQKKWITCYYMITRWANDNEPKYNNREFEKEFPFTTDREFIEKF